MGYSSYSLVHPTHHTWDLRISIPKKNVLIIMYGYAHLLMSGYVVMETADWLVVAGMAEWLDHLTLAQRVPCSKPPTDLS